MMCPRCGHKFVCGCNSCRKRTQGQLRWKFIDDESEACGRCGLVASLDQWMDEEYAQLANGRNEWPRRSFVRLKQYLLRPWRSSMKYASNINT